MSKRPVHEVYEMYDNLFVCKDISDVNVLLWQGEVDPPCTCALGAHPHRLPCRLCRPSPPPGCEELHQPPTLNACRPHVPVRKDDARQTREGVGKRRQAHEYLRQVIDRALGEMFTIPGTNPI